MPSSEGPAWQEQEYSDRRNRAHSDWEYRRRMHIESVLDELEKAGCTVILGAANQWIQIRFPDTLSFEALFNLVGQIGMYLLPFYQGLSPYDRGRYTFIAERTVQIPIWDLARLRQRS